MLLEIEQDEAENPANGQEQSALAGSASRWKATPAIASAKRRQTVAKPVTPDDFAKADQAWSRVTGVLAFRREQTDDQSHLERRKMSQRWEIQNKVGIVAISG